MKKFLCRILVCAMPLAMLAGCTGVELLSKTQASQNAANFTFAISQDLAEFQANVAQKIADNAGLPVEEAAFDFSALSLDDGAEEIYHNTTWDLIEKTNAENLFALSAFHIFETNYNFNQYDISFLSSVESDALKSFCIQKAGTNGTKTVFLGKLSGLEGQDLNLPVATPSQTTFVDRADDVIKQLGNNVKFEVDRTDVSTRINIMPSFVMPTQDEVLQAIGTADITANFEDIEENKITLVYTANDETYSKEIVFEPNAEGVMEKKVLRYTGDKINDPSIAIANEYSYTLALAPNAPYEIFGDYEISFGAAEGGIYCRHTLPNQNIATICEYYVVKTGEIVARIKNTTTMGLMNATTIDLLIESNLSQGKIKYAFQKLGETAGTLRNEPVLTKNFCDITEAEYALAGQTTTLNVEIVAFEITDTKFNVTRAVQKG
ncbi:MAG: hypothetical protein IKK20_01710 [Clostridia bacterium]|nr:hypothetical protein [Clostridia bacterium]